MSGMKVGYIRVSAIDQNPDRQLIDISLDKKFIDKASGASTDRPQFQAMMTFLREGDFLYIHSLDRLGRNLGDVIAIMRQLTKEKGVTVHFVTQGLIFFAGTENSVADLMLNLLGSCAQYDLSMIRERQREGIALYKKRGGKLGREQTLNTQQIEEMKKMREEGLFVSDLEKHFKLSKSSVYRYLEGVKPKRVFLHELTEAVPATL